MADTATVTPGPDVAPAPAAMLSGGMQGPPPQVDTPQPNVQPQPVGATNELGDSLPQQSADVQQAVPGNAASDPEMVAAAHHHQRIGNALLSALGGAQTMHVIEQPDGSFIAKQVDATPGEKWARIAKAALMGAAAGFANGQGPGGKAKAFSAGAQTGLSLPQTEQDQTMKKAGDLEAQREKKLMYDKNMAMLDIQQAKLNFENMSAPYRFAADMQDSADKQRKSVTDAHGKLLATYTSMKDLNDHLQSNQELADKMLGKGGVLRQVPIYTNGKQTGAEVYGIPEDYLHQYNDKRVEVPVEALSPDNTKIVSSTHVFEPGTELNSNITAFQKKQELDNQTAHTNLAKIQTEKTTADAAALRAQTDDSESASRIAKNYAEAAKAKDDTKTPKLTGYADPNTGIPYVFGKGGKAEPMELPAGMSAIRPQDLETFRTKTQNPALKGEEAYKMLKTFDANMRAGVKNPIEQRIALQMALQTASGMSPTSGTGGATGKSNAALTAAMKDKGLAEDKIVLINRLIDGDVLSQKQMDNALRTANAYRLGLWKEAAAIGAVSHITPENVIPANVLARDRIMGEIYGDRTQPGAGNTSGAARASEQPQLPKPMADTVRYPVRPRAGGGSEQWDGEKYVQVQP